ncbi:MAG TPA: hypothetical protein VLU43_02555 [Anaeromyxobacteraceae bacterium]|nr:hypothetical protein [Anaeromyxobacteraceae bacterium]
MATTCVRVSTCPLFQAFAMRSSLNVWRTSYCEGDFARCERLKLADSGQPVPPNLLPNGRLLELPADQVGRSTG